MRIHLLGQPSAQTTKAYSLCGFAQNIMRFSRVLHELGYEVMLYAGEENEAPCTELVTIVSKKEQRDLLGGTPYYEAARGPTWPLWQLTNQRTINEIRKRRQESDIICTIGGASHKPIFDHFPSLLGCEYNVGYEGSFSDHRVFQSYAWMHYVYGLEKRADGCAYDTVIPAFYDPADFQVRKPEDYFLFVGRLTYKKGITVAIEAAKRAGAVLKFIGHGDRSLIPSYYEDLGTPDMERRNKIIAKAKAVFCPTQYVEPFNCVAIEAQLSSVPVISTDFGGMTETVEHGKTGFRCYILNDFVEAIRNIDSIDRNYVRKRAIDLFSIEAVKPKYREYFERLQTRWGDGWYFDPQKTKSKTRLWYPDRIAIDDSALKSAESGLGMWDQWQAKVKASLPNFAAPGIFVSQDRPQSDYIESAQYVAQRGLIDVAGKARDEQFGAIVYDTPTLGRVTRAWLDSNIEIDFLRRNLGDKLSKMSVLDIGAGYGRLAVSMRPFVREFICVDGVEISTQICRQYTQQFAPSVKVVTKPELTGLSIDLAMNIHSWNECSYIQIQDWIQMIVGMDAQYLFFVSHSPFQDRAYEAWSDDGKSFQPLLEQHFTLVAQEVLGMSDNIHVLWKRKPANLV